MERLHELFVEFMQLPPGVSDSEYARGLLRALSMLLLIIEGAMIDEGETDANDRFYRRIFGAMLELQRHMNELQFETFGTQNE